MRVHVYSEELTGEGVEILTKDAIGITFYGLRFWLKSAPELHSELEDDDRSAVTFWADNLEKLYRAIDYAHMALQVYGEKTELRVIAPSKS